MRQSHLHKRKTMGGKDLGALSASLSTADMDLVGPEGDRETDERWRIGSRRIKGNR